MPKLSTMVASIRQAKQQSGGKEAYRKFFNAKLKKWGVKSPGELDDAKKKKFFAEIEREWKEDKDSPSNEGSAKDAKFDPSQFDKKKKGKDKDDDDDDKDEDKKSKKGKGKVPPQFLAQQKKKKKGEFEIDAATTTIIDADGALDVIHVAWFVERGFTVVTDIPMEVDADGNLRNAELSIAGYLKGVQKAIRSWMGKDLSDEDKAKAKKVLAALKS